MTTINAAAATLFGFRSTIAALAILTLGALAGCTAGGGNLLNSSNSPLVAKTALQSPSKSARAKVAIAPVIGAPSMIAKQIVAQLGAEASKNNIAIAASANEQVDYTVRGYIVAAREVSGTKVSYIWDVLNSTGARVHRISGEELVNGAGAGDPWASVSPQLIQVIAVKTGQQLNSWMPQQARPTQSRSVPVAATQPSAAGGAITRSTQVASNTAATAASRSDLRPTRPMTGVSGTSTSSIGGPIVVAALVPRVVGAPGDGPTSLADALRSELQRNGVIAARAGSSSYRVEGRVRMGRAQGGQQPIKIDWVVRDPNGQSLGTVSQENKIPAGSLNGNWGPTASAAAAAATQGILKLLPKRTASANR